MITVTIGDYPALATTVNGINKTAKKHCPQCSTDVLNVTIDDLGQGQIASKLVAYLQSHPKVNYVLFTFADLSPPATTGTGRPTTGSSSRSSGRSADDWQARQRVAGAADGSPAASPACVIASWAGGLAWRPRRRPPDRLCSPRRPSRHARRPLVVPSRLPNS
jgi:hypothetical protein